MTVALPVLAVAFAAFCIWLAARRTKRPAGRTMLMHYFAIGIVSTFAAVAVLLLAVVVAIGLLQRPRRSPRDESDVTRLHLYVLKNGLEMYAEDHGGNLPPTEQGLRALVVHPDGDEVWKGPYIRSESTLLDGWGVPLNYDGTPVGTQSIDSIVWSNGPDKKPGTADDVRR